MSESSPPQPPSDSHENIGEEQMQAMSLLGGGARPEGLPQVDDADFAGTDESRGPSINQSTILVVVVLIIAIGSLYAMRLTQGDLDSENSAQVEAQIEQTLVKLNNREAMGEGFILQPDRLKDLFEGTDQIISMLEVDHSGQQVPINQLSKNPFDLGIETGDSGDDAGEREARLEELRRELDRLRLQSVMGSGDSPVAVIDGEFYQAGQSVGSFRIENINGNQSTVELSAADETFMLTMED